MAIKCEWIGKIEDGKLPYNISQRAKETLQSLNGKIARVCIEEHKETRSDAQNRLYWKTYVTVLSEETGYTKDEIHTILKHKFLGYTEVNTKHETIKELRSTRDLNTKEFSQYLEDIFKWATFELNINLPTEEY